MIFRRTMCEVARIIKDARIKKNAELGEIALDLGVEQALLQKIETGTATTYKLSSLIELAQHLGCEALLHQVITDGIQTELKDAFNNK